MGRMGHSSIAAALPRHTGTARITLSTHAAPAYRRYCVTALTLSIMALCLLLRTLCLGALPLFFDEGVYTRAAQVVGAVPGPATLLTSLNYGAPPLYSWLAAPLTRLLPDPLLAARLTSALIGTATALAVWAIARAMASSRAEGPLAAVLYALCPFALFYNRMALLDGLLAACGAGALYFALRLARDARGRDALALGLCLAAAMLTKIFAADMLLLPLLAVVAARPAQRRAVRRLALLAAALGLAPLAGLLLTPQGAGLLSATHAHAHAAGGVATVGQQLATWGAALWLYLTPPVLLLALLGLWSIRRQRAALIVGPWALLGGLPPVLVPGAFLAPRYFLYSAVPILVLAAYGLVALVAAIVALSPFAPSHAWASSLAPCGGTLPLAPPAHGDWPLGPTRGPTVQRASGGAWGDASPQTPAIKTVWRMVGRVLANIVGRALVSAVAGAPGPTARRGAWRSRGRARRMEGSGDHKPSPMSRFRGARDECMAGVWGEASPQAPPEARWTVGPRVGPRGQSPWAGGARGRVPPQGARDEAQAWEGARGDAQAWEGAGKRGRLFRDRVRLARGKAAPALLILCVGLAVIPSVQADAALIGAPARAPYIPFDRWQYVTGWPSGYALMDAVAYLRRQERRGPITVVSSIYNPPGDALAVLLGRDPRVTLTNRDFNTLSAQPLRATRGRLMYLIVCQPYGQRLPSAAPGLRVALRAPDGDGAGGVDVYAVIGR